MVRRPQCREYRFGLPVRRETGQEAVRVSTDFQTVVKTSIERDRRRDALERLVADKEQATLAVLVRTDGLAGEFRRQAVDGLAACGGTEQLDALADDPTIPASLRRRAREHL